MRERALRVVWRSRFYRSCMLALVISGIAVSSSSPQIALFFVQDLHSSLAVAGVYYLTNVAAPVAGFLVGRYSDRVPDRLRIYRLGAVVGAAGWLAMALSPGVWTPFVVSVLALSVASACSGQVYAAVRDELSREPGAADTGVLSTIRMAFTAGWVVGPVVGSAVAHVLGIRLLFVVVAGLTLAQAAPLVGVSVRRERSRAAAPVAAPGEGRAIPRPRGRASLVLFSVLCMLALSGDTLKFAFLPVYMDEQLHVSAVLRGAVIATQPVFELMLIPVASVCAARFGAMRVLVVGSAFGVGAHLCYALSTSVAGLFAGQVLMSLLWACIAGLGVTIAQRLHPQGVGLATSTFLSTTVFASTLGGLVGALGAPLGLPHVFLIPAAVSAVACAGLALLSLRLARAPSPSRAAEV